MTFLFVYPNEYRAQTPQMGIVQLGSLLLDNGYDAKVADLTFSAPERYSDELMATIERVRPEVIGFSMRTQELPLVSRLTDEIRKRFKIPLIVGGPAATFEPASVAPYFDYGVIGDGEGATLDIARAIADGRPDRIREFDNVFFLDNGHLHKNKLRPLYDLEQSPMPRFELFDERHYTQHYLLNIVPGAKVGATFEGSRGCPYQCTYCSNSALMVINKEGGKWRREKSGARLRREIDLFRSKYDLDMMYFVDEVIMTTDDRTAELREHLADLKTPFIFMERPELIREKRVKDMAAAGAYSVSIGVESGDQEFRTELLKRRMDDEKIVAAYRLMQQNGIKTHAFIMMGLPEQTPRIMAETVRLLHTLQPDTAQATTFFPLPGTVLYDKVRSEGLYDGKSFPSNYYSMSVLAYSLRRKLAIADYATIVNMGFWRADKGNYGRVMTWLCLHIPLFSLAIYYPSVLWKSMRRVGLKQTWYRIKRQLSRATATEVTAT